MMNAQLRQQLIAKIKRNPTDRYATSLVSLEDFFNGNDDAGSIGCNLEPSGPEFFEKPLFAIRAKPEVQDVLIAICGWDEDDETAWPFSDRVYVLTSAAREEVELWFAPLQADEIEAGWVGGLANRTVPTLQNGTKVWSAWWD